MKRAAKLAPSLDALAKVGYTSVTSGAGPLVCPECGGTFGVLYRNHKCPEARCRACFWKLQVTP